MDSTRQKVLEIYQRIKEEFYKAREDFVIKDQRFSSTLLFELIAFLTRSCILLVGGYGCGKTTSSEVIGAVMGGLPYDAVLLAELRGSPELTREDIIGRPHLGKLHLGEEKVIWSAFVRSPVKIVDELPRIPEIKQSLLLQGVETGKWTYLNGLIRNPRQPLAATANFEDLAGGSFQIVPALADRFSLSVEASYPGVQAALEIAIAAEDLYTKLERAGLMDHFDEAARLLSAEEYKAEELLPFCERFKKGLEKHGWRPLYAAELEQARGEIEETPFSDPAAKQLSFLISSMNACPARGQKRSARLDGEDGAEGECPRDCRFFGSPCSWALGEGSRRQERDIALTAKALAWLLGDPAVEPEHIFACAPFCTWHRHSFAKELWRKAKHSRRGYPLKLEVAFTFVDQLRRDLQEMSELFEFLYANRISLQRQARNEGILSIWGQEVNPPELLVAHAHDLLELDADSKHFEKEPTGPGAST